MLFDQRLFPVLLGCRRGVLEITAAAEFGPGVGTGWLHPLGAGLEDLGGVSPQERGGFLKDRGADAFTGERVTNKDHLATGGATDSPTGGRSIDC